MLTHDPNEKGPHHDNGSPHKTNNINTVPHHPRNGNSGPGLLAVQINWYREFEMPVDSICDVTLPELGLTLHNVTWYERGHGLGPYLKLPDIPIRCGGRHAPHLHRRGRIVDEYPAGTIHEGSPLARVIMDGMIAEMGRQKAIWGD